MLSRKYILFLVLMVPFLAGLSQNASKDSLVLKKATEAFELAFSNSDSAIFMAREALEEASGMESDRAIANAHNSIGWAFLQKGYFDSSITHLVNARKIFDDLNSDFDVTKVDINLAEAYTKQNKISEAIRFLLEADSLSNRIRNIPLQTDVKRQLAIVYRESGDHIRSADYFRKAMEGFKEQQDYFRFVNTAVSLSILYRNMKLLDSSLSVLQRSLGIVSAQHGTDYQKAMVEENLGETYFQGKHFEEALKYYSKAYQTFQALDNKADLAYEAFCVGRTLSELHRYPEAEKYLLKSYAINDSLGMINYQLDASTELASLYHTMGEWQKAYQFLQKAAQLKDSLDFAEQVAKTNELKERFESEKQSQEIELLRTKNQLAVADNRRTRIVQLIFILLFITALIIGWLLLNRFRIKKKLEQQVLRNRIARDLHDDIGSTLSSIDISSRIAMVKRDDPELVFAQLSKIRQQAVQTMDSMSDIVWSINPVNDNFESMLSRMREFATEICEPGSIHLSFEVEAGVEKISLDDQRRKNIFLLFKESVNNALKYSDCTTLDIRFGWQGKNKLLLTIRDNGKGFERDTVRKGNGLTSMRSRAEQLGGIFHIESGIGKGTVIQLECPV
ncbi:MAG: tetratricopeptide repeat protein [Terrimonas sp.]|nr:tetratricopeptide repeat protein [Terrimonas sp.]